MYGAIISAEEWVRAARQFRAGRIKSKQFAQSSASRPTAARARPGIRQRVRLCDAVITGPCSKNR